MTLIKNSRVLASHIPEGVAPNKTHFRTVVVNEPTPQLKENEIFVKNLIFNLDPYIRRDFPDGKTESTVVGFGISKVLDSNNVQFPVGAIVLGPATWEEYTHLADPNLLSEVILLDKVIDSRVPLSAYNGILGGSGYTVWESLKSTGNLKKGETIYISSAAGTLGQIAGQLAKRQGLRVIGSAGTDEKVAFLKNELGFDAAFNYKTQDPRTALAEAAGSAGLDIYYDLVGDNTLEIALDLLNPKGRILFVGALSRHQNREPFAPKNLINILFKQLRYEGYEVFDHYEHLGEFWNEITPLVVSGELKYKEIVLKQDVSTIAETYLRLMNGEFAGKVNIQITDV
ncbi:hypothetical protein BGZ98_005397 [Dissophora globulifera]|nr:hypothetical protein BGZ98_005397 [Dissophora globulifera]